MSLIPSLLKPDYVLLDIQASSKQALFEEIAQRLSLPLSLAPKVITKSLADREKLGSTGLGQGVAIPHGRIKQLQQAAGVFVRTRDPVPFGAPDNEPVRLLFVLLVPLLSSGLQPPNRPEVPSPTCSLQPPVVERPGTTGLVGVPSFSVALPLIVSPPQHPLKRGVGVPTHVNTIGSVTVPSAMSLPSRCTKSVEPPAPGPEPRSPSICVPGWMVSVAPLVTWMPPESS